MKIAIVSHLFPRPNNQAYGIFVLEQAEALSNRGHQVDVVSPVPYIPKTVAKLLNREPSCEIPRKDSYGNVTVYYPRYLSLPYSETLPLVAYSFRRTLAQHRHLFNSPDLINAHVALPDGFGSIPIAQSLGIPLVTTVHGSDLQHSIQHHIRKKQIEKVFEFSEQIVLNSTKLHNRYTKYFENEEKVEIIFNGFDSDTALESGPSEDLTTTFRIISVGDLRPEKGHRYVLKALAGLKFDFEYIIIGDGTLRTELEQLALNLGVRNQVKFLGEIKHKKVFDYLKSSNIFVLPSYEEAFGIAYLEAMACGVPVIACEGEGPADFIAHHETGFLVPPKDPVAIKDVLCKLRDNPELERYITDRGQRTALYGFSWQRNAKQTERAFNKVITNMK